MAMAMAHQGDTPVLAKEGEDSHLYTDIVTAAGRRREHNGWNILKVTYDVSIERWLLLGDHAFPQLVAVSGPLSVTSHQSEQDVVMKENTEEVCEVRREEMWKKLRDNYLGVEEEDNSDSRESQVAHGDLPVPVCGEAIDLSAENDALKLRCQLEQLKKEKTVEQAKWKKEQGHYEISLGRDKEDELKQEIQDLRAQLNQYDRANRVNEFFAPISSDQKVCDVPDSGLSSS